MSSKATPTNRERGGYMGSDVPVEPPIAPVGPAPGSTRKPAMPPWQLLNCEDGGAITVPDDWTDKIGALTRLLSDYYGGEWSTDNPVLVEALKDCRIAVWHSFRKGDAEGEGIDWEPGSCTFYGDAGSGAKYVTVLWYCHSLWALGERAEEVEPKAQASL